jgi:hypothetical protein
VAAGGGGSVFWVVPRAKVPLAALTPGGQSGKYTLPPAHPLLPVQSAIRSQVQGHGASGRHALKILGNTRPGTLPALSPDQVRLLRRHFLPRSAGLGFWSDGRKGMGERRENDKLKREVSHG